MSRSDKVLVPSGVVSSTVLVPSAGMFLPTIRPPSLGRENGHPAIKRSPRTSQGCVARRPTDLLPSRFDRHAGDLLLDRVFDLGLQRSPRPHRDSAHLPTPSTEDLPVHHERTRPDGLGPQFGSKTWLRDEQRPVCRCQIRVSGRQQAHCFDGYRTFQPGAVRPKGPLFLTLDVNVHEFHFECTKRLLRVGKLSSCGRPKGSGPPAGPPSELLGRRGSNRPQEPPRELEARGFRRLRRRLDKPPRCRGSIPHDPHRAGHRRDSQLAEIHPSCPIGEVAFRASLPSAERTPRFFGGSFHSRSQNGIAREPTQSEDSHILTRDDVHRAPRAPHLHEPRILPGGRRYVLYASVERQDGGSGSAVLKSRERGLDESPPR